MAANMMSFKDLFWLIASRRVVPAVDQMLFAKALSQGLDSGIHISFAIQMASRVPYGRRMRNASEQMNRSCRSGYSLEKALFKTGIKTTGGLLAALRIGECRNTLPAELSQFARSIDRNAGPILARRVSRPNATSKFATTLARLLESERLAPQLILDAGEVAAMKDARFQHASTKLADDIRNGWIFSDALQRQPEWFDFIFCDCVAAAASHRELRTTLLRLVVT